MRRSSTTLASGTNGGGGGSMMILPPAPEEPSSPRSSSSSPVTPDVGRRDAGGEASATTCTTAMVTSLADELTTLGGFDLCHPFHTSWYNSLLTDEGLLGDGEGGTLIPLPDDEDDVARSSGFDSSPAAGDAGGGTGTDVVAATTSSDASACRRGCNALLIGNTRRMWPRFIDWLREEKKKQSEYDDSNGDAAFDALLSDDPLDTFVTEIIGDVVSRHAPSPDFLRPDDGGNGKKKNNKYEIFWSHDTKPRRLVSMQRVAQAAGFCHFDREYTVLSIHPTYGPWVAFRAVVVFFDVDQGGGGTASRGSASRPPPRPPPVECLLTEERAAAARISLQSPALSSSGGTTDGGGRDLSDLLLNGAGDDADARGKSESESDVVQLDDVHVALIGRRDCIALGRDEYRYSEGQILYHYTKDRRVLLREMCSSSSRGEDTCT